MQTRALPKHIPAQLSMQRVVLDDLCFVLRIIEPNECAEKNKSKRDSQTDRQADRAAFYESGFRPSKLSKLLFCQSGELEIVFAFLPTHPRVNEEDSTDSAQSSCCAGEALLVVPCGRSASLTGPTSHHVYSGPISTA